MKRLLVASATLLLWSAGCSSAPPEKSVVASSTTPAPTTVTTVALTSKKLQTTVSLPAQLTPYEQVDIYPKVTGFVQTVTVDRGSRVQQGQVLVRLTAPELVSQRSQAEAAVLEAESRLATTR